MVRRYARLVPALGVASRLLLLAAILAVSRQTWLVGVAAPAVGSVYSRL